MHAEGWLNNLARRGNRIEGHPNPIAIKFEARGASYFC